MKSYRRSAAARWAAIVVWLLFFGFQSFAEEGGDSSKLSTPHGLIVQDGKFYLNGVPYRGMGVNYYDLLTRRVANPKDNSSIEGLKRLAREGIPFVRFNGGGFSVRDLEKYQKNKTEYFKIYDEVVQAAEQAGIGLIPSLFWNPNWQKLVGEHRDSWGDPNSKTIQLMREFVSEVVGRYKSSPAIWAWELGNEWNLKVDLPNAAAFRQKDEDERDDMKSHQLGVAVEEFAAAVRKIDPHRAITTGHSHPRASAWHNKAEKSWKSDSLDQWKEVFLRDNTKAVDTLGLHLYANEESTKAGGQWADSWETYFKEVRKLADEKRLPIFLGEFGLPLTGVLNFKLNPEEIQVKFKEIVKMIEATQVDLSAVWVYDLSNQNSTWNVTFENDRAYMLHEVIAANRRLNGKKSD